MAKRKIVPIKDLSDDTKELYGVLNEENDLPLILISTSYIDACLASILERKLIKSSITQKLLGPNGPIGGISVRADLSYSLGVIEKSLYQDLLIIMRIRNEVAHHHIGLNFNEPYISELCNELNYLTTVYPDDSNMPQEFLESLKEARNRFTMTVVIISQKLLLIGKTTKC